MESNREENTLRIATTDYQIVKDLIVKFNKVYKSKFIYLDSIEMEGVMFGVVDINGETKDRIFLLGTAYGTIIEGIERENDIL